jgi:hypothetical protein
MYHEGYRRIWFKNNTNHVKFLTLKSIMEIHPMDTVKSKSYNNYMVFDLNYMPASFYHENLTVADAHLLNKYKDFIINGL